MGRLDRAELLQVFESNFLHEVGSVAAGYFVTDRIFIPSVATGLHMLLLRSKIVERMRLTKGKLVIAFRAIAPLLTLFLAGHLATILNIRTKVERLTLDL